MKTNRWLILLVVSIPIFMIEMAGTSIFVALEPIASDLNVTIEKSVWLATLYLAANASIIPLAGWLGKKMGYKRVILGGIVVFGVSALLGATAHDFHSLVLFRALQGLGDGPVMPVAIALLLEIFPANQRGRVMVGIWLAIGMAPALGPLFASSIVEEIGWRGIFYMNVIWALVSFTAVTAFLPSMKASSENIKINWPGFILLAIGTGSLQLFLDRGQHYDWFNSNLILGFFIAAFVSLTLYFVVTFMMKDRSVLDFSLLKDLPFLTGNLANMLMMGCIYGVLMGKILYLQMLMGFTAVHSGNYQAVLAGTMLVFSVIAGILTDKISPRWPVIIGLPVCVYALFLASRLSLTSDMASIVTIGAIMGAGIGFVVVPLTTTVFVSINQKDMGAASVLNSYLTVISSSISMALIASLLMHRMDVNFHYLAGAVTLGNPALTHAICSTSLDVALPAAYEQIVRQATMFAFNDVWYLMAFVLILLVIYLPFMKTPKDPAKV